MARKKPVAPISLSMTFDGYQNIAGLNYSTLKHLRVSPLHFKHNREQPPQDRTAFMLGRASHGAILEPDRFPLDFAVYPGARRAGNDWDAFKEAHRGQTIIKAEEYAEALAIRDAVRGHRVANKLLSGGEAERTLIWTDAASGLVCKGRIDYLRADGFVDVKRTAQLDPRRFQRTAYDLGYHLQAAWYRRGIAALRGIEHRCDVTAWVVAVEASLPHDVAPFRYDPGALATADEEIDGLLATLVECERKKRWPGRYEGEAVLELPGWAYDTDEGDVTEGLIIGGAA
jgi:hypothetical protein